MKVFSKAALSRSSADSILLSWVFLRGLALIYFAAFASMAVQIEGLVGSDGILPAIDKLALIEHLYQQQKFWQMPTIFWLNASDVMLNWACYLGMAVACLLLFDIFTRSSLIIAYVLR